MAATALLIAHNNKRHLETEEEEGIYGSSFKRHRCGDLGFSNGLPQASDVLETLGTTFPELGRTTIQNVLEASGYDPGTTIAKLKEARIVFQNSNPVINTYARQSEFEQNVNVASNYKGHLLIEEEGHHGVSFKRHLPDDGSANSEILKEHDRRKGCEFVTEKGPETASEWVQHFVQQMVSASDMEDAKSRAASVLEAFEKAVVSQNSFVVDGLHQENGILKEKVIKLESYNQILKRSVLYQNEKRLEYESSSNEIQQLRNEVSEYKQRISNLELKNYELNLHLQMALQTSQTIPAHFNRDIF